MPVADDEHQLPMFLHNSQDPGRDLLVHVVDVQAEAIRNLTGLLQLAGLLKEPDNGHQARVPEPQPPGKKIYRPQNKALREWHTFRAHFQHLEHIVRRDHQLEPDDEVTREMLYAAGGPPPKTMTRHQEFHGLKSEQWPPSTWPEEAPSRPETP
jgi:hypothetical protein